MPYGRNINLLNLDRWHRPSDMAHGFQQLLASYVCSDVKGTQLNKPTENIWWLWIFRNIEPLAEATTVVTVCY